MIAHLARHSPLPSARMMIMDALDPKPVPPKRKLRWFQFGLRTLLIGVALAGVICAILVPTLRRWWEDKGIVEQYGMCPHSDAIFLDQPLNTATHGTTAYPLPPITEPLPARMPMPN